MVGSQFTAGRTDSGFTGMRDNEKIATVRTLVFMETKFLRVAEK